MYQMTEEWSDAAVRRFIARIGRDNLEDLFAVNEADIRSRSDTALMSHLETARERVARILASEAAFNRAQLAVNGSDMIEQLGIEEGPLIGEILQKLLDMVIDRPEINTREQLLEIAAGMREGQ
jgi:poly(A) polymerase/tRNA nucleotidyltransferase (CCA-adding enzyme)